MLIVGTAGHIDHGKTTLVGTLTGTDTDRLAEEKRRGISIDLGFAHMSGTGSGELSFVDVPGHERFVKNMLAGVGGIGAVLLVVAADEGVKPQTLEHFEICRLLQIPTGVIALTKADMATPERLGATSAEVARLVKGSFLESVPVLPVSAHTGAGLDALRSALFALGARERGVASERFARLAVDRSFAVRGFGTVVTGTLVGGELRAGDSVRLHGPGKTARIRGLQVHNSSVTSAEAGHRVAVNLSGIEHIEIERGAVLTHDNELDSTSIVDLSVEWLPEEPVPVKRERLLLHIGTAEIPVTLKILAPGRARVWLSRPVLALPDDRFILRRPSPPATVGGGSVLDPFPPGRMNRTKLLKRLQPWPDMRWPERIQMLIDESPGGRSLLYLAKRTGLTPEQLRTHVGGNSHLLLSSDRRVISHLVLERNRKKVLEWLAAFHTEHPNQAGAPLGQARRQVEGDLAAIVFESLPEVRIHGELIALKTHAPKISPEQARLLGQIEQAFRKVGITPPAPADVLQMAGADASKGRPFLEALIKARRLVRVTDEIVFHADVIAQLQRSLQAQKGRKFSIPEFKEWTKVSRKYAVPLLEYLDRQRVTRREGDARVIL